MSKKYTPSGYQIINITIPSDYVSGTGFVPSTEDEKILFEILKSVYVKKPVLLNVFIETTGTHISGFLTIHSGTSSLAWFDGDGEVNGFVVINVSDTELVINFLN